ncbi:NAD-dependent epimerase/dehydratase family protein [Streptomyces sp. NPDC006704]|uniref:NAD-dependent epimerase/dehydratase family protein n=1 Tax=Streptomyces sp. NPDC006704 TaxID=3364760 RepID=UPI0036C55085
MIDRTVPSEPPADNGTVHTVDLRDAVTVESALSGADRVVHLGGVPDEAPLPDLLEANVLGTHHVLEAARRTGIERVLLASSNRVTGFHPAAHLTGPTEPARPDGLYGVSKVAVEALGQLYADKFGLSVICLRIGSFEARPTEPRYLATWLSPRDAVGYIKAALTAPSSTRFLTAYAVSVNSRRFWQLPDATELDYVPVDNAEAHAAEIPGDLATDPTGAQAGLYAEPEFTLKHRRP